MNIRAARALSVLVLFALIPACGGSSGGTSGGASGPVDITVPEIAISAPSGSVVETTLSPITVEGTASDNVGIVRIEWASAPSGGTGQAFGGTLWSAAIWLIAGPNHITITAVDAAGNERSASLTVILRTSNVYAWGGNTNGQLGDGTTAARTKPVQVPSLSGTVAIDAGVNHTMAIRKDGTVWNWGDNSSGQLGDGTTTSSPDPIQVTDANIAGIIGVAAGLQHSLALRSDGTVWAWGADILGTRGDGVGVTAATDPPTQVLIAGVPLTQVIAIDSGYDHALALRSDGTVVAWGNNIEGQLGTGSFLPAQTSQAVVTSAPAGVKSIAAGGAFSLALLSTGLVYSWGDNEYGQLAQGSPPTDNPTPTAAGGLTLVTSIAAGDFHASATRNNLMSAGNCLSWGRNNFGQLGNTGTSGDSLTPVPSGFAVAYRSVRAGGGFTLALREDGNIDTWGLGGSGQRGNGSLNTGAQGQGVSLIHNIVAVAAGGIHALAIVGDSPIVTVGLNGSGQLGDGTPTFRTAPVVVSGLDDVEMVACGNFHGLAVLADGTMRGWGSNNAGQIGDGTQTGRISPVVVADPLVPTDPLSNVTAAVAGATFSVALKTDGTVWAWGTNSAGQLGFGSGVPFSPVPVQALLPLGSNAIAIAAGFEFAMALLDDGTIWSWGANFQGQLGAGLPGGTVNSPVQVSGITTATAIACGAFHALAILSDGTVRSWGSDARGQLGSVGAAGSSNVPVTVDSLDDATAIAAGDGHSLAVADGEIWSWGGNDNGQLGDGTTTEIDTPVLIPGFTAIVGVASGAFHSMAWKPDGTLLIWGQNNFGQLGDRSTTDSPFPQDVFDLAGVIAASGGYAFTAALLSDGSVRTWGDNGSGQLGDGTADFSTTPVVVHEFSGATEMAAGFAHAITIHASGLMVTWGANDDGQLGDGTTTTRFTPVVIGISQPGSFLYARHVACGRTHTLAVLEDGRVRAWGANGYGQVGDGSITPMKPTPTIADMGLPGAIRVGAGLDFSMAALANGDCRSWGDDSRGQMGNGGSGPNPLPMTILTPAGAVKSIASGSTFGMALLADGTLRLWGSNGFGELGTGSSGADNHFPAAPIAIPARVKQISAGFGHCVALLDDGTVWTWGLGGLGQLGRSPATTTATPTIVPGLDRIVAVTAGALYTLALRDDGVVFGFGFNPWGELGATTPMIQETPIATLTGATGLAAGDNFTLSRQ